MKTVLFTTLLALAALVACSSDDSSTSSGSGPDYICSVKGTCYRCASQAQLDSCRSAEDPAAGSCTSTDVCKN
jgi:hypothetical protein